jgi:hypothetical protein
VTEALKRIRLQDKIPSCSADVPFNVGNKKSSLGEQISELYGRANLPPDSLIHDPRIKSKAKPGDTYGIQGSGSRKMSKKEKAYHAKLNAKLKRSRKRKPDFICSK